MLITKIMSFHKWAIIQSRYSSLPLIKLLIIENHIYIIIYIFAKISDTLSLKLEHNYNLEIIK